ncbi:MAG TPA: hypothetical protein PKH10_03795 [bacterium]|nr:hypothetical protein [bacterium]
MATDIIRTPEEARRFARVVLSDILAYNGPKIEKGLMEDNLFESLRDELYEGELYYRSRVEKGLCDSTNFFNMAMVDLLIKAKGGLKTPLW